MKKLCRYSQPIPPIGIHFPEPRTLPWGTAVSGTVWLQAALAQFPYHLHHPLLSILFFPVAWPAAMVATVACKSQIIHFFVYDTCKNSPLISPCMFFDTRISKRLKIHHKRSQNRTKRDVKKQPSNSLVSLRRVLACHSKSWTIFQNSVSEVTLQRTLRSMPAKRHNCVSHQPSAAKPYQHWEKATNEKFYNSQKKNGQISRFICRGLKLMAITA